MTIEIEIIETGAISDSTLIAVVEGIFITNFVPSKLDATVPPSVTDDTTAGYVVGSHWVVPASKDVYVCTDSSTGAAVWSEVSHNNIAYEDFNITIGAPAYRSGRVFWDDTKQALSYYTDDPSVTVNMGQEILIKVRNMSGSSLLDGQVVNMIGSTGNIINVDLADASAIIEPPIGVVTSPMDNNAVGYVTLLGAVTMNTVSFNEGDVLWVDPAIPGALTVTKPTTVGHMAVRVGIVIKSSATGILHTDAHGTFILNHVNVIDDLSDVDTVSTAPTPGDHLEWDGSNWVPLAPSGEANVALANQAEAEAGTEATKTMTPLQTAQAIAALGGGGGGGHLTEVSSGTFSGEAALVLPMTTDGQYRLYLDVRNSADSVRFAFAGNATGTATPVSGMAGVESYESLTLTAAASASNGDGVTVEGKNSNSRALTGYIDIHVHNGGVNMSVKTNIIQQRASDTWLITSSGRASAFTHFIFLAYVGTFETGTWILSKVDS